MHIVNRTDYATAELEMVIEHVDEHLLTNEGRHRWPPVGTVEIVTNDSHDVLPDARGFVSSAYRSRQNDDRIVLTVPAASCHNRSLALAWLGARLVHASMWQPRDNEASRPNIADVAQFMSHDFMLSPFGRPDRPS